MILSVSVQILDSLLFRIFHNSVQLNLRKSDSLGRAIQCAGLRPFDCWDHGIESRSGHGYFSLVSVVCYVGRSLDHVLITKMVYTECLCVYVCVCVSNFLCGCYCVCVLCLSNFVYPWNLNARLPMPYFDCSKRERTVSYELKLWWSFFGFILTAVTSKYSVCHFISEK